MKFKSNSTNPFYDKSIFREIELYSPAHIKWTTSVLNKLRSTGILPTFIQKDKDFDSFWGWICHFFAVIVIYGRQFLDIFTDKDLFWEFLKQKDLYRDTRVDLYENLEIYNNQDIPYIPILNKKIVAGYPIDVKGYICSDYLPIEENNILTMKSSNIFEGDLPEDLKVEVGVAFYDEEKKFVQGYTTELSKEKLEEINIEKNKYQDVIQINYDKSSSMFLGRSREYNRITWIFVSGQEFYIKSEKPVDSNVDVIINLSYSYNSTVYEDTILYLTILKGNTESLKYSIVTGNITYRVNTFNFTNSNLNVIKKSSSYFYCWDDKYIYYNTEYPDFYIPTDLGNIYFAKQNFFSLEDVNTKVYLKENSKIITFDYQSGKNYSTYPNVGSQFSYTLFGNSNFKVCHGDLLVGDRIEISVSSSTINNTLFLVNEDTKIIISKDQFINQNTFVKVIEEKCSFYLNIEAVTGTCTVYRQENILEIIGNIPAREHLINVQIPPYENNEFIFDKMILESVGGIDKNNDGFNLFYTKGEEKPENPKLEEIANSEINGGLSVDLLIETGKNIKYFVFSYPAIYLKKSENVFLVKPYISGEGYYNTKNLTKESLLNIYNTFRKRGTLNSLNYIKNICETNLSDLFYSNYLNKDNIGWYLNKAYPLNKFLTKNIDLSNILIKNLIPLSNGEFVEFYDNFLSFSDSNCLKIKWERRLEFSVQKVIVFCTLYDKDKKAFYPPMVNTIINTEINGLVIENIPKGITELSIPIKVIEDARQKDLGKNLINIDYTKEIYLFLNNITYNNINYELKYLQLKAIHFITDISQKFITADDNLGETINQLVIGNSLSNLDLEQVNFSLNLLSLKDKLIKFKLDSNSILNFEKTLTQRKRNQIFLNIEEKKDSNRETVSINNTNSLFKINLNLESFFDCNLTFNNQDNIQRFNRFYFTLLDDFGNRYSIISVLRSYIPAHTTEKVSYYGLEQGLNCKKITCRRGNIVSSSSGKESYNIKINNQIVYVGALDFTSSSYEIEFNLTNSFELSADQKYIMDGVVNYIIN